MWAQAMEKLGLINNVASIQNSYNFLDCCFNRELAEAYQYYNWSVLAGGLLTGKYRKDVADSGRAMEGSRFTAYPEYMRRWSPVSASPSTLNAVDEYATIAADAGMTPAELAIAFCRTRQFISNSGSVIVGATTTEQLKENLSPFETPTELDAEVLEAINRVHLKARNPSCYL
jgi:aryl-alcohol dehydrogenase-like predicted oxidoreductase